MDKEYVKKSRYGKRFAFPMLSSLEVMPAMVKDKGFADHIVVSSHNDVNTYYKPFYEGDTLYQVVDFQKCWDITPAEGSCYRTFVMSGKARVFNQNAELVADGANILKESFRRHRDKSKRNTDGVMSWESPNWWARPKYYYTDADWEKIIGIWILPESSGEKGRGGPGGMPEGGGEPPPMNQNRGWVPSDLGPNPVTPEVALRDGRSTFQNSVAAKLAAGMICDWMGDDGWLQQVGWDIMDIPSGSDASINYQAYPTRIPDIPREYYPDLFDKYPYMEKVPFMRGCRAAWHVLENDLLICKAYVTGKYKKGNDYFVDLTWWDTTFDNYMVQEGVATVKLPKK